MSDQEDRRVDWIAIAAHHEVLKSIALQNAKSGSNAIHKFEFDQRISIYSSARNQAFSEVIEYLELRGDDRTAKVLRKRFRI